MKTLRGYPFNARYNLFCWGCKLHAKIIYEIDHRWSGIRGPVRCQCYKAFSPLLRHRRIRQPFYLRNSFQNGLCNPNEQYLRQNGNSVPPKSQKSVLVSFSNHLWAKFSVQFFNPCFPDENHGKVKKQAYMDSNLPFIFVKA
jgi:hypothetical protein